jgi:hypothetical protein
MPSECVCDGSWGQKCLRGRFASGPNAGRRCRDQASTGHFRPDPSLVTGSPFRALWHPLVNTCHADELYVNASGSPNDGQKVSGLCWDEDELVWTELVYLILLALAILQYVI